MAAYVSNFKEEFLCCHPKETTMSFAAISRYMNKSVFIVIKWVKMNKCKETIDDLSTRGTHHTTSKKDDKVILIFDKDSG